MEAPLSALLLYVPLNTFHTFLTLSPFLRLIIKSQISFLPSNGQFLLSRLTPSSCPLALDPDRMQFTMAF